MSIHIASSVRKQRVWRVPFLPAQDRDIPLETVFFNAFGFLAASASILDILHFLHGCKFFIDHQRGACYSLPSLGQSCHCSTHHLHA
jgi:hypothetical protein